MRRDARVFRYKYLPIIAYDLAYAFSFQHNRRKAQPKILCFEGFCLEIKNGGFTAIHEPVLVKADITSKLNCLLGKIDKC